MLVLCHYWVLLFIKEHIEKYRGFYKNLVINNLLITLDYLKRCVITEKGYYEIIQNNNNNDIYIMFLLY